jgi:hypothetical protein
MRLNPWFSLTGTKVTFEDGTVIHMSLKEGFRLLCSLSREGWGIRPADPPPPSPESKG